MNERDDSLFGEFTPMSWLELVRDNNDLRSGDGLTLTPAVLYTAPATMAVYTALFVFIATRYFR